MKNKKIFLSEKKILQKIFPDKNISKIEIIDFYFEKRKKIIVFVPENYVEKVFNEMCDAGAGIIGNYTHCSFRTPGTGTYMPQKNAKPFAGKSGKLEYAKEVKLELECGSDSLNIVVDALNDSHPYEEIAYEIYDFTKRTNKTDGVYVHLKKNINSKELISKINPSIDGSMKPGGIFKDKINKVAVFAREFNEEDLKKLKQLKIKTSLFQSEKNIKIVKT
ncbi:MAG TPA: hypothetical protein VHP32_00490 [Ignavibacteria bacterium]|nr:hypothetical protein [Ignavibacteria bacterium]